MALPKLSAQQAIVNPDRTPSSPFLQFMEKTRSTQIETDERQDDTDALLAAAITDIATALGLATAATDAVADLADGTTPFTGLNVGGTDVKPFLDKTDGSALTDSTGLASAVVDTDAIAAEAVTAPGFWNDPATVDCKSTTDVLTHELTITTEAGEYIDLQGRCDVLMLGSGGSLGAVRATPAFTLYRDATLLSTAAAGAILDGIVQVSAPAIAWYDEPAAGTHTYKIYTRVVSLTNVDTYEVASRYLSATRIKR